MTDQTPMVRIPQKWPLYTFVVAIIGASIFYADMRTATSENSAKLAKHEGKLEGLDARTQIHALELATSRVNQENIIKLLTEMKQDLRDLKRDGSPR